MMQKKNAYYLMISLIILLLYIFGVTTYFFSTVNNRLLIKNQESKYISKEPITVGDRILIVAPHPDDEVIGMGGLIYNELKNGKKIKVVLMTNGDDFRKAVMEDLKVQNPVPADFIRLGEIRQKESISALNMLGLHNSDIIFLGYGDGTLSYLWNLNWDSTNPKKAATGYIYSPYDNSFTRKVPYTGENVVKDLTQIIKSYKPTDIFYPDPDEMHPDHWATSNFVKFTVEKSRYRVRLYSYLVHHYQWPTPALYMPKAGMYPPVSLATVGTDWHVYALDGNTVKTKHEAMLKYKSQYKVMAGFLDSFVRKNELFGTYGDKYYNTGSYKPDLTQKDISKYTVIYSGVNDNPILRIDGRDDIRSLGLYCDKTNYYFVIQARGNIDKDTTYAINALIFYQDGKIGRVGILGKNFQAKPVLDTNESIDLGKIDMGHYKNRIWFVVPAERIGAPAKIFLNGETYFLNKRIDKTAWRVVMPRNDF